MLCSLCAAHHCNSQALTQKLTKGMFLITQVSEGLTTFIKNCSQWRREFHIIFLWDLQCGYLWHKRFCLLWIIILTLNLDLELNRDRIWGGGEGGAEWSIGARHLDKPILEWLSHFTEVEINKKQKRPGCRCKKASITEISNCDTSHYRPSIAEGPFSSS